MSTGDSKKNTSDRVKTAAEYEAKAKELRRKEKAFLDEVDSRWDELKVTLNKSDDFDVIYEFYGAITPEQKKALKDYILSDRQKDYFRRTHGFSS